MTSDAVGAPADNSNTPDVTTDAVPTAVNAPAPTEEPTAAGSAPTNTEEKPEYKNSTVLQDEKVITNGKGYRQSEIAGAGAKIKVTQENLGEEKEGVRVETLQPSPTSPDKRSFGVEVNFDKPAAERTYNGFIITDRGRNKDINPNKSEFLKPGEELPTNTEDKVTYQPDITNLDYKKSRQSNFDYVSTEDDRKHIANKDNGKTTLAWKGEYDKNNPNGKMFEGENFEVSVGVNPYPNENKDLSLIGIGGATTIDKVPVKNQYVVSDAKITNAGEEDYTRLIGEVYHPSENTLVNGAQALIVNNKNIDQLKTATGNDNLTIGQIVFKMPEGALQNKNSIFNDVKFQGVQSLRAKFYARPRTAEEFTKLAKTLDEFDDGSYGYVSTGAGTKEITHNGEKVTIDKQGIARYDHYNLIGEMTINLDDTKFYDQSFKDGNGQDTSEHTSSKVLAGESFEIKMFEPQGDARKDNQKSATEMNAAKKDELATGVIKEDFIITENKRIAEKLGTTVDKLKDDQKWVISTDKDDVSKFTITPPKSAKAGEFIAVPVEYTYTNGSKDIHWFHFVVQDSDNNKPEYKAEVGFQGDTLKQTPQLSTKEEDEKKNQPKSYKLKEGAVVKDERGNVWSDIKVDPQTGEVSVVVPTDVEIIGGESIFVPVVVEYDDPNTEKTKTEEVTAQFIARPKYTTTVRDEDIKEVPFASKEEFDDTIPLGEIRVINPGKAGKEMTVFEQDVVNGQKGLIDPETGKFTAGDNLFRKTTTKIEEKEDRLVKVGIKPVEETVTIPHTIEYIVDPTLKPGEEVYEEGWDGEVTVKTTRNPETGEITITKEETLAMQPMKIKVGAYEHKNDVPFDTTVEFDDNLPAGTTKTVTEGVVGKTETKVTPAKIADMDDMMKTIGEGNFLLHDEEHQVMNLPNYEAMANYMVEKGYWDADKITKTTDEYSNVTAASYNGESFEDLLNFDAKNHPAGKALVKGKVETKTITEKQDKVIKVGTKTEGTVVDTDEIPFKVKVEKDPSLKKGEWKYKKNENGEDLSGKVGTNKKTWTIVNSKVVGEPSVEKTDPVDAVILVGDEDFTGEVTHTTTEETPYEVQIVERDDLPKGTTQVHQQGVAGKIEKTYKQQIVNGEAQGNMTEDEAARKVTESKPHVIYVGTKPLTGSTNVETKNQKPFDVEIEYDNTKPAGTVEIVPNTGVPGEETKTTPVTSEDGTVTPGETTTKEEKAPINKKIIVGTQGYNGEFKHEYTNIIPFETEVEIDPTLAPNEVKEVQPGVNGETKTTVTQTITNGVAGEKQVSEPETTKKPVNRKIKVGAKSEGKHSHTESVPFKVEVQVDKSLKPGEYRIEKPGTPGSKTTTWKIENSKVVGDPTVETTPAADALVLVGDKAFTGDISHTTTEGTPFKVEIVERDDLPKGTTQVHQEGQPGSITRTYKQHIDNGQPQGEMAEDETARQVTEAKPHIIYVGTKPLKGSTTVTTTNKKPFDVEIKYDNTKPIGFVEETGGQPGEESTSTDVTATDGNLTTGNSTTTETAAPVKKVITVGTKDYTGEFTHEYTNTIPFETEVTIDPSLKPNEIVEDQKGINGVTKTTVTQSFTNGTLGEKKVSEPTEVTKAQNRKIRIGSMTEGTHTHTEDIPFDYEVKYDPNIEAGKYEIEVAGEKGTRTTKWTIKNSEVQGNPEVTETQPTNAIIKVGNKDFTGTVTHTDKKEIPFEVEIVENPNLLVGTKNVKQQGEAGEKEVTYTQAIKNGQADGELKTTENQTKAPKKHIIEVGTKPVEGNTHEVNEDVSVEIEYVTDENLEKGKVETGDLVPGKVTSKLVNKIVDGKVVTEEVKEVTPAKQIIKVGAKDFTGTVTHEVKEEVPYTVRIVEDTTMKPGTSRVEIQGKPGSKTTKYSQDVVNGQASGDMKSEVIATTDPTEHVIHVGTAPVENSKNLSEEVPAEVEYVYDETKDKGKVEKGEYTPGKVETKVVNKYDPKTGEITTTEEKVVTPAKQKIIVGTKDFTGEFTHEYTNTIPFETEVTIDPSLKPNEIVEDQKGINGVTKTTVTQSFTNGTLGEKKVSEPTEVTKAQNRKIRIGSMTEGKHSYTEELPFKYEVKVNPEREAGTYEVIKPGKVGSKTTEWTITNSVPGEGKVTAETPAENAVIEVGNKDFTGTVTHTETVPVPNTVEIRYNPDVKAGETKVLEEGTNGSVDVTYTQQVKNGQPEGDLAKTESNRVEPKNRIIEVGTMPESAKNTETVNSEVPVEIEYVYDDTKDKGTVEKGEFTPGKVETTVENVYENGQLVSKPTTKVTSAKQKIIVGTKDFTGEFKHTDTDVVPFETEVIFDNTLKAGEQVVDQVGENGEVSRTITQPVTNGVLGDKQVSEPTTTKEAKKQIIRVGTMTDGTHTTKCPVPFETKVEVDPNLAKGEYKVETPGQAGEQETTYTIKNSQVVGTPETKQTKAPVTQVIKVGNKDFTGQVSHEVIEDLAFEVEIIEDDTLDAGTIIVDKEGVKGSKTTKYTQAVKNGQADGELKSEVIKETPAQKRVVRVSKKPGTCPIPEGTETLINKDVPVEIEYVYDNTKDKGFVETGEVTPGKVETKVVSKLVDGKIVATEETVVTPAKQKIVVGTKDYEGTFSHETTSEQAYKTQVIFDENLEAGKVVEVQPGQNGQTKETVTQTIVNGVPQAKKTSTSVITQPQDRIIRVGTKGITTEKLQETIKELPVEKIVEIIKEVPQEKLVEVINEIVKVVPQESIKELIKEVPVTRIVEIVKEVPVEVIKEIVKEVPEGTKVVEIIKEVPVEVIKEVVKEIPAGTKVVEVVKEIVKEVPVETIKDVPGIQVRYNDQLKPGEVKVVDRGQKRVTITKNGQTTVVEEGRDMIVEVGCAKCERPGDPDKPVNPDQPDKPNPGNPDQPGDPDKPNPGTPDQPGDPDKPNPGTPDQPGDPDKPNPGTPDQPGDPDKPNPGIPDQPGDPDKPNPGTPDQPGDKPEVPSESSGHSSTDHEVPTPGEDPKTPGTSTSQTPTQSGTQDYSKIMEELDSTPPVEAQSVLPDTGEASSAAQYGVAGLSLLAGLGLLGRRRRKEEE
ncbi:G5 domain-containing protein [Hutsoniella sourekii]|uniref:G5 domain-containing protein n=1 Tax=Hutsoniella sourekii TaxID=87650 RepID=UPI0004AF9275|nr:G5 domain-containing protein [Hutsoniella sourekii]